MSDSYQCHGPVAFLFLMVQDSRATQVWQRFFQKVDPSLYTIYCHTKRKPTHPFWQQCHISRRIPTQWGTISLVEATLLLLKAAYQKPDNQYFVLVSDSCIPIVDFNCLYRNLFRVGKTWLHYKRIENRISRYQQLSLSIQSKISWSRFYSQHQWMALRRSHVGLILQMSPLYLRGFHRVHAADEHYIVTLLELAGKLKTECLNQKITYCDWSDPKQSHPTEFKIITDKLVGTAQSRGCFFLRKIKSSPQLGNYLNYILNLET